MSHNLKYISKVANELESSGRISDDLINDLLIATKSRRQTQRDLYERYKASKSGLPIYSRTLAISGVEQTDKVNKQLGCPFFSEITDDAVGFLISNPVSYGISKEYYGSDEERYARDSKLLRSTLNVSSVQTLDYLSVKYSTATGEHYRLLSHKDGQVRINAVYPWEAIPMAADEIWNCEYALRAFSIDKTDYAYLYTPQRVQEYVTGKNGYELRDEYPHGFSGVPLIGVPRNENHDADAMKTISLQDAYAEILSDTSSEIEQFRLAYLAITGADDIPAPGSDEEKEFVSKLLQTGMIFLPDGTEAKFITKKLDAALIKQMLDIIEDKIYRFSGAINYSNEKFGGNVTGVALKQRMQQVKNKTTSAALFLSSALQQQFRLMCQYWQDARQSTLSSDEITWQYTYNFPTDIAAEADVQAKLQGLVSTKTRLSLFSSIEDVQKELAQMEREGLYAENEFALSQLTAGAENKTDQEVADEQMESQ